jgi:hypothetical protein
MILHRVPSLHHLPHHLPLGDTHHRRLVVGDDHSRKASNASDLVVVAGSAVRTQEFPISGIPTEYDLMSVMSAMLPSPASMSPSLVDLSDRHDATIKSTRNPQLCPHNSLATPSPPWNPQGRDQEACFYLQNSPDDHPRAVTCQPDFQFSWVISQSA